MQNKLVNDLIVVAGHAPFQADVSCCPTDPLLDKHWVLNPNFQLGEPPFYLEHIRCGLELVTSNPASLLLFSGGLTRPNTHWTEAKTYVSIAKSFAEFSDVDIWDRVDVEEYARDSFENLTFGICRFWQLTGKEPANVRVVSWSFKEERFRFHAKTLRLNNRFEYFGVNDPDDLDGAKIGESKALKLFFESPEGTSGVLLKKRIERNFGDREHGYQDCPAYSSLIERLETVRANQDVYGK